MTSTRDQTRRREEIEERKEERKKDSLVALRVVDVSDHDRNHSTVVERLRRRLQLVKINVNIDERSVRISVERKKRIFSTDRRRRRNLSERHCINACHDWEKARMQKEERIYNLKEVFKSFARVKKMWMIKRNHEICSRRWIHRSREWKSKQNMSVDCFAASQLSVEMKSR